MKNCAGKEKEGRKSAGKSSFSGKCSATKQTSIKDHLAVARKIGVSEILEEMI